MLLPALQQARERGKATTCANNLKTIGFAVSNYQGDHKAWLPGDMYFRFYSDLVPYLGLPSRKVKGSDLIELNPYTVPPIQFCVRQMPRDMPLQPKEVTTSSTVMPLLPRITTDLQ